MGRTRDLEEDQENGEEDEEEDEDPNGFSDDMQDDNDDDDDEDCKLLLKRFFKQLRFSMSVYQPFRHLVNSSTMQIALFI